MAVATAPQPFASSRKGAEGAILASALVVAALYSYRKLIEPAAVGKGSEPALRQIIGAEPKPAPFARFAVAYGFTFFSLSVIALAAPEVAAAFAILVGVGYTLTNGASIFTDITRQVGGQVAAKTPANPALKGLKGAAQAGTMGG